MIIYNFKHFGFCTTRRGECGAHGDSLSQEMGAVALAEMAGDLTELVEECMVCSDMKRDTLFGPCGHVCCCSVCAPRVKKCLVCKEAISARTKVSARPAAECQLSFFSSFFLIQSVLIMRK